MQRGLRERGNSHGLGVWMLCTSSWPRWGPFAWNLCVCDSSCPSTTARDYALHKCLCFCQAGVEYVWSILGQGWSVLGPFQNCPPIFLWHHSVWAATHHGLSSEGMILSSSFVLPLHYCAGFPYKYYSPFIHLRGSLMGLGQRCGIC